jgi:hypothetical protein
MSEAPQKGQRKKYIQWTPSEDSLLLQGISLYNHRWSKIASHVGTRNANQCQIRYTRYVYPKLSTKIALKTPPKLTAKSSKTQTESIKRFHNPKIEEKKVWSLPDKTIEDMDLYGQVESWEEMREVFNQLRKIDEVTTRFLLGVKGFEDVAKGVMGMETKDSEEENISRVNPKEVWSNEPSLMELNELVKIPSLRVDNRESLVHKIPLNDLFLDPDPFLNQD